MAHHTLQEQDTPVNVLPDKDITATLVRKDSGFDEGDFYQLPVIQVSNASTRTSSPSRTQSLTSSISSLEALSGSVISESSSRTSLASKKHKESTLLPEGYRQCFIVRRDRLYLNENACAQLHSPKLARLDHDRHNWILVTHERPTMNVSQHTLITNFPLLRDLGRTSLRAPNICLGSCVELFVTIEPPAKTFEAVYALRRTIDELVCILRASGPLPRLNLSFTPTSDKERIPSSHFAILMGPFHKLTNCVNIAIDHEHIVLDPTTGDFTRSPRDRDLCARRMVWRTCDMIRSATSPAADTQMRRQQLILDIKLELLREEAAYHHRRRRRHTPSPSGGGSGDSDSDVFGPTGPFSHMSPSNARRVELACADLVDLHRGSLFGPPPGWVAALQRGLAETAPAEAVLGMMETRLFPHTSFSAARDWIGGLQRGDGALGWQEVGLL